MMELYERVAVTHTWNVLQLILLVALMLVAVGFIVLVERAERRVPVQYASRMMGRRTVGGQSTHLPIRVNAGGVMPVIFAGAIMSFPPMLLNPLSTYFPTLSFLHDWAGFFSRNNAFYYTVYALLIFGFSYFWISIKIGRAHV